MATEEHKITLTSYKITSSKGDFLTCRGRSLRRSCRSDKNVGGLAEPLPGTCFKINF